MTRMMGWFIAMSASVVLTSNIVRLIPVNQGYHASWIKVVICIALIIWSWFIVRYSKE